jgi:hypothetical protein
MISKFDVNFITNQMILWFTFGTERISPSYSAKREYSEYPNKLKDSELVEEVIPSIARLVTFFSRNYWNIHIDKK